MESKLQQLTDKLYNDGLSKGKQEADELISLARKEVAQMLAQAEHQSRQLVEEAQKKADELKRNAEAEVALASRQTISRVKQTVENMIITQTVEASTTKAFNDVEFIQEMIRLAIDNLQKSGNSSDIQVLLPESRQKDFMPWIEKGMAQSLGKGVDASFDKGIKSGFRLGITDGRYQITFTESDFVALFKMHIRSKLSDLLFGKA